MNKQTKTLLGLAAVAGIGYYAYTQYKKKKSFANAQGKLEKCYTNIPYPHQVPCNDPRVQSFANAAGNQAINYRKAGSVCHYYVGDELMKGRVSSYDNSMCEGTASRGKLI
jgi:hypothetical protein